MAQVTSQRIPPVPQPGPLRLLLAQRLVLRVLPLVPVLKADTSTPSTTPSGTESTGSGVTGGKTGATTPSGEGSSAVTPSTQVPDQVPVLVLHLVAVPVPVRAAPVPQSQVPAPVHKLALAQVRKPALARSAGSSSAGSSSGASGSSSSASTPSQPSTGSGSEGSGSSTPSQPSTPTATYADVTVKAVTSDGTVLKTATISHQAVGTSVTAQASSVAVSGYDLNDNSSKSATVTKSGAVITFTFKKHETPAPAGKTYTPNVDHIKQLVMASTILRHTANIGANRSAHQATTAQSLVLMAISI